MNPKSKIDLIQDRIKYLRDNTDFVSTLFESLIGYAILAADFDGNVIAYNEGARVIYGYTPEEIIGKQSIEIFFPKHFIKEEGLQQIIDNLISKNRFSYEQEKVRKNGERFPAQILLALTKDRNGRIIGFVEIAEDLTERKQAEAAQIQREKLAALGTMSAGVAHELNNPMMGTLNFIQYCIKHTSKDDRRHDVLKDAERETKRCIDIVQNLGTFSHLEKEGKESYQQESFATILDRVLKLLSYRVEKEHVSLTSHVAQGTPEIWMQVSSMQQVFLNLISNALDAVRESQKKEIHVEVLREDEFIQVTVADSGCGIPPENLKSIFDPFFTTKASGQGTGLGLSISHSIVKLHGGEIMCENGPGTGSKFKILFPIERRKGKQNE